MNLYSMNPDDAHQILFSLFELESVDTVIYMVPESDNEGVGCLIGQTDEFETMWFGLNPSE